ncbi:MAG: MbnP family protein [Bacteroidota bacterium]
MKKIALLLAMSLAFTACNNDDNDPTTPVVNTEVNFRFTQNFDGAEITNADFDATVYTNANGENLTLSKLVYLISDITFTNAAGEKFDAGDYNLVDARNGLGNIFTPGIEIPEGEYNVSFTYGFDDEDNQDGVYLDLNVADGVGWGVPAALGGGYHYMRMEGMYENSDGDDVAYQYHNIRAAMPGTDPLVTMDTSIEVDLGIINITEGTNIEIRMNVAEWYRNPNLWDLNELFTVLMPNYDAQIMMNENGQTVFSLGEVTGNAQ